MNLNLLLLFTLYLATDLKPSIVQREQDLQINSPSPPKSCGYRSAASWPIDVFVIAGQSNATGLPDSTADSPKVPHGKVLKYDNGSVVDGNDPMGDHSRGSAWPEFGIVYTSAVRHNIMFVPASVPGSAMAPVANVWGAGSWAPNGTLSQASIQKTEEALVCVGSKATFKGVLWDQGENDAGLINVGRESIKEYKSLLISTIHFYRSRYGQHMPFFIFQTGTIAANNQEGYTEVREAQRAVSAEVNDAPLVFSGAYSFAARGLMAKDGVHYSQAAYNEMGKDGALGVLAYYGLHVKS